MAQWLQPNSRQTTSYNFRQNIFSGQACTTTLTKIIPKRISCILPFLTFLPEYLTIYFLNDKKAFTAVKKGFTKHWKQFSKMLSPILPVNYYYYYYYYYYHYYFSCTLNTNLRKVIVDGWKQSPEVFCKRSYS